MNRSLRAIVASVLLLAACTPGQRGAANSALDIATTLCIIAHQAMPDSEVAKVCGIVGPFVKPMQDVLAGARHETQQQVAAARTGACPPPKESR